jgi:hypothetical protein
MKCGLGSKLKKTRLNNKGIKDLNKGESSIQLFRKSSAGGRSASEPSGTAKENQFKAGSAWLGKVGGASRPSPFPCLLLR